MKTKTYRLNVGADEAREYTKAEYEKLAAEAASVLEDPAEYAGHVVIIPAVNEAGDEIMLGLN